MSRLVRLGLLAILLGAAAYGLYKLSDRLFGFVIAGAIVVLVGVFIYDLPRRIVSWITPVLKEFLQETLPSYPEAQQQNSGTGGGYSSEVRTGRRSGGGSPSISSIGSGAADDDGCRFQIKHSSLVPLKFGYRQIAVLQLILNNEHMSLKEAAYELRLDYETLRACLSKTYARHQVKKLPELIAWLHEEGHVELCRVIEDDE